MRHGFGKQTWYDGVKKVVYEGFWNYDKPDKNGMITYSNGDFYAGGFRLGFKYGMG